MGEPKSGLAEVPVRGGKIKFSVITCPDGGGRAYNLHSMRHLSTLTNGEKMVQVRRRYGPQPTIDFRKSAFLGS